jgi:hypothetical protein
LHSRQRESTLLLLKTVYENCFEGKPPTIF